jgi:multidrug transporter EmrE-like cation transporter
VNPLLIVLLGTQVLFTTSDLLARANMRRLGFRLATFRRPWFLAYSLLRLVAVGGRMFILSQVYLGQVAAMLGATSIVVSNVLGALLLRETLSPLGYLGVSLALTALLVMTLR